MALRFGRGPGSILIILATVVFVLVAFGVEFGDFDRFELAALGLALFAAGHVV